MTETPTITPKEESLTKLQSAHEVVRELKYCRNMFLMAGISSSLAIVPLYFQNVAWTGAFICGSAFITILACFNKDRRIYELTKKYGNGAWNEWTIAKMLERNKE